MITARIAALLLATTIAAAAALLASARPAFAQSPEPPPEAPEGVDYESETNDSLSAGNVEVDFGASGRGGGALRRSQRVRMNGDGLTAGVREGRDDPLAGADVQLRALGGTLAAGKLAPRWGRGLMLGTQADPWARTPLDGDTPLTRAKSGEGWSYRRGADAGFAVLGGRFAKRDLAGLSLTHGAGGLAALTAPRVPVAGTRAPGHGPGSQVSSWWGGAETSAEVAFDARGRWRAEASRTGSLDAWRLALGARAGAEGFRPLAAPARAGPARAATAALERADGPLAVRARLALWRFTALASGARAALELQPRMAQHGDLILGFEEQHGPRRAPTSVAVRGKGLRQGLWGEWRAERGTLGLSVRHETWGSRAWAQREVRGVSTARLALQLPLGASARFTHSVYRVQRGESLYLAEAAADRLILRAVSGAGERSRFELNAPAARGTIRAAFDLSLVEGKDPRAQWTLDWIRRTRTR